MPPAATAMVLLFPLTNETDDSSSSPGICILRSVVPNSAGIKLQTILSPSEIVWFAACPNVETHWFSIDPHPLPSRILESSKPDSISSGKSGDELRLSSRFYANKLPS